MTFKYFKYTAGSVQSQQQMLQQVVPPGLLTTANNLMTLQSGLAQPAMATVNQGQLVSGGTVYQMVQTPQGLVAQPLQVKNRVIFLENMKS